MTVDFKNLSWNSSKVYDSYKSLGRKTYYGVEQLDPSDQVTARPFDIIDLIRRLDLTDDKLELALYHANKVVTYPNSKEDTNSLSNISRYWNPFVAELIGVNDMLIFEMALYYGIFHDVNFDWKNRNIFSIIRNHLKNECAQLKNLLDAHFFKLTELRSMRNYLIHKGNLFPLESHIMITESLIFSSEIVVVDSNHEISQNTGPIVDDKTIDEYEPAFVTFKGPVGSREIEDTYLALAGFSIEQDFRLENIQSKAIRWFNDVVECVDEFREFCVMNAPVFDLNKPFYKPKAV